MLKISVLYGADAVYLGGETMGLRAKARNFTWEEMEEGIAFAHARGVKVYVTANIFAHNADLKDAERYFSRLRELRPDAVLIADPGMFRLARRYCPEIPVHISTQANTTNAEACTFWYELGPPRTGDRVLRPRRHVHFLFGTLPAQQLSRGQGREPRGLHPSLPLEIRGDGGDPARGVHARRGK